MRLEDLVPPLELCKQIPDGAFEESAFIWHWAEKDKPYWEFPLYRSRKSDLEAIKDRVCPAPTLAEIMDALVRLGTCPGCDWIMNIDGEVYGSVNVRQRSVGFCGNKFPATALKLWMEETK